MAKKGSKKGFVKIPTANQGLTVAKGFGALKIGQMASRAAVKAVAGNKPLTDTHRIIVAAGGVLLALVYNGPQKDVAVAAGLGMAVEQGGSAIDALLQKEAPLTANAGKAEKLLKSTYGLNGSCGCGGDYGQQLNGGIRQIDWDRVYNGQEYADFEEVAAPLGV